MARNNSIPLFATPQDWMHVLRIVVARRDLIAVAAGMFDRPEVDLLELTAISPPTAHYLVTDRRGKITLRAVPQRGGGTKFAIDQLANPQTVSVQPGFVVRNEKLIAGHVGTASEDPVSIELFSLFFLVIHENFVTIKSYLVGPQAATMLDAGVRLTPTAKSPAAYDLRKD